MTEAQATLHPQGYIESNRFAITSLRIRQVPKDALLRTPDSTFAELFLLVPEITF